MNQLRFRSKALLTMLLGMFFNYAATAEEVNFSRDVLPLLSDRCFHCHGPDENHREADLRLDEKEAVFQDRDGHAAVVAGNLDESELFRRITSDDEDEKMPPPDSNHKPLTQ